MTPERRTVVVLRNIRRELVLDEGDAVAQMQLALLQALDRVGETRRAAMQ
jgi:hypothetical protein